MSRLGVQEIKDGVTNGAMVSPEHPGIVSVPKRNTVSSRERRYAPRGPNVPLSDGANFLDKGSSEIEVGIRKTSLRDYFRSYLINLLCNLVDFNHIFL